MDDRQITSLLAELLTTCLDEATLGLEISIRGWNNRRNQRIEDIFQPFNELDDVLDELNGIYTPRDYTPRDYALRDHNLDHYSDYSSDHNIDRNSDYSNDHNLDHYFDRSDYSSDHYLDHYLDHFLDHYLDHNSDYSSDHNSDYNLDHTRENNLDHNLDRNSDYSSDHNLDHNRENNLDHNRDYNRENNLDHNRDHNLDHNGDDANRSAARPPSSNRTHQINFPPHTAQIDFPPSLFPISLPMVVARSSSSRHDNYNRDFNSNNSISTITGNEPSRSTNESLDQWIKAAEKNSKLRLIRGRKAAPIMVANQPQIDANPDGCSICLENFKLGDMVRVLPCLHLFHAGTDMEGTSLCIDACFDSGTDVCPQCRANIVAFEEKEHETAGTHIRVGPLPGEAATRQPEHTDSGGPSQERPQRDNLHMQTGGGPGPLSGENATRQRAHTVRGGPSRERPQRDNRHTSTGGAPGTLSGEAATRQPAHSDRRAPPRRGRNETTGAHRQGGPLGPSQERPQRDSRNTQTGGAPLRRGRNETTGTHRQGGPLPGEAVRRQQLRTARTVCEMKRVHKLKINKPFI